MKKRRVNPYLAAGLVITGLMLAVIVVGIFWTPYAPTAMKYGRFQAPSLRHLFGTDNFGRDIFSRVLKGSGTTLAIALSTVSIGAVVGTLVGAVTGYFGGWVDEVLMRLNDALTAFPSFLLALLIVSLVGPGKKYSVVLALGLVFIPSFARVMRAEFASLRGRNFVTLARLMGAKVYASLLQQQLIPGVLYFLAVLVYERVLLRHTEKPWFGMAFALLVPLAMDFWYLTGLMGFQDVTFIFRVLAYSKAVALAAALFLGIGARKRYEKES